MKKPQLDSPCSIDNTFIKGIFRERQLTTSELQLCCVYTSHQLETQLLRVTKITSIKAPNHSHRLSTQNFSQTWTDNSWYTWVYILFSYSASFHLSHRVSRIPSCLFLQVTYRMIRQELITPNFFFKKTLIVRLNQSKNNPRLTSLRVLWHQFSCDMTLNFQDVSII